MNLIRDTSYGAYAVKVPCLVCGEMLQLADALIDTDGPAFRAYYHEHCVPCTCRPCSVCRGQYTICGECQMCTRCHSHQPGCRGCPRSQKEIRDEQESMDSQALY